MRRFHPSLYLAALIIPRLLAQDIITYGQDCARRIAAVPAFDCRDGVEAAVTVDGRVPSSFQPNMSCDRPALLPYGPGSDGQCVPFSRALVLRDDGKVQISAFCRQKKIRAADSFFYDEVDVILHSVSTGGKCHVARSFAIASPSSRRTETNARSPKSNGPTLRISAITTSIMRSIVTR